MYLMVRFQLLKMSAWRHTGEGPFTLMLAGPERQRQEFSISCHFLWQLQHARSAHLGLREKLMDYFQIVSAGFLALSDWLTC